MTDLDEQADRTTLVVGASRGLGRGIATAIVEAGGPVIAVARSETALAALAGAVPGVRTEVADAGDPSVTGTLLDRYDPERWFWWPARGRSYDRCSSKPGRHSRSTGTPTSGSPFSGYARHCSNRWGRAAG